MINELSNGLATAKREQEFMEMRQKVHTQSMGITPSLVSKPSLA